MRRRPGAGGKRRHILRSERTVMEEIVLTRARRCDNDGDTPRVTAFKTESRSRSREQRPCCMCGVAGSFLMLPTPVSATETAATGARSRKTKRRAKPWTVWRSLANALLFIAFARE